MKYEEFIKLFTDRMKRYEARFYASIICVPIWVGSTSYNGVQNVDIIIPVILIFLAIFFARSFTRCRKNLKTTKKLMEVTEKSLENIYVTGTGQRIRVHSKDKCIGRYCVIHNPSDHNMKDWPTHWRDDRGLMERICSCGVGHPDPDDLAYKKLLLGDDNREGVHGCCGCCMKENK